MSPQRTGDRGHDRGPYQLFMITLCVWALAVLAGGTFFRWSPSTRTILDYADNAVCGLFFIDFLITLSRVEKKRRYLLTWGWIDLISSIPTVDALRWGRAARLMRLLRVLRGVRSARALTHFVVARRAESAFLAAVLATLVLLVAASIAILEFEIPAGGNIGNAEDAMWWSISTMTTVGYAIGIRLPRKGGWWRYSSWQQEWASLALCREQSHLGFSLRPQRRLTWSWSRSRCC